MLCVFFRKFLLSVRLKIVDACQPLPEISLTILNGKVKAVILGSVGGESDEI